MFPVRVPLASKTVRYGMVLFTAVGILLISVRDPGTTDVYYYGPFGVIRRDKWSHAIGYAILTAAIAYARVAPISADRHSHRYRNQLALSVGLAVAFGICVELIQWPIPYRTVSGIDAIANTIGACLLAVLWLLMMRHVLFGESDGVSS